MVNNITRCFFLRYPGIVPSTFFRSSCLLLLLAAALLAWVPGVANAQTGVAATVGEESILIERLQPQIELVLSRTPAEGDRLDIIKAQILEENIKQRLVYLYLKNSRFKATPAEIELEISDVKKDLTARKKTLNDLFKERGINEEQLKRSLAWDISWGKYLDNFLTDENLKKYFEKHRSKFDGTQLHVSHVLIKPEDDTKLESWRKAFEKAKSVHAEIKAEKISFEDAVIEHSSGATKINKGDLGWIGWRGPMAPEFTIAAFQLKTGDISVPVQSSFGFHLIKLIEIKPGKATLEDVRPRLLQGVKRYLFDWLANKQVEKSPVKFTGEFPYFEFGTKKLGQYKK